MRKIHLMPVACLLAAGAAMAQSALLFKKNGVVKFSITEFGNLTTDAGYYTESAPGSAAAGEFAFRESTVDPGQEMITSADGNLLLKGRIVKMAVTPAGSGHLGFKNPSGARAATLTKGGDLFLTSQTSLAGDPSTPGPFSYTTAVYASSGTQLISRFQSPTPNYVTPRKNISPFFNSIDNFTWGFDASSVPLNGTVRIPTGSGPFPLVLFVHGNHDPLDYSDEGYLYLCDMLASQGIIAGSIDANFLNGGSAENDARAILHLEHVKQFRTWNAQSGHPLFGKVDLNRVMIVGHSRGGEGVGHASYFNGLSSVVADAGGPTVPLTGGSNGLGPYNFGIKCVFAIAPTDGQYVPVGGPRGVDHNYFVIAGGRDGDLKAFWGLATFDRSHKPNVANPSSTALGFKAFCFAYNANHNYFNTTWDADSGDPNEVMSRAEQEQLARVYVGALAQSQLLGRTGFMDLLREATGFSNVYRPWSSTYVTEYQDKQRTFFDHYEEDANTSTLSPPFTGSNSWFGQSFVEEDLSLNANPWHRTKGLRLDWGSGTGLYSMNFNTPAPSYPFLALRIGQNNSPSNPVGGNQDCKVWTVDGTGHWGSVPCDSYGNLPYPRTSVLGQTPTTMQTLRIPMSEFANQGVNVNDIRAVQLEFGTLTTQGSVYADEFQFTY